MVDGRMRRLQEAAGRCKRLQELAGSRSVYRMRACVCVCEAEMAANIGEMRPNENECACGLQKKQKKQ